ncbi:MmcQ/YjbR family DNA-binding protein [Aridibaculum aurantiacum]|uniref:MmcQ/YjbR family DNA-binding protein n=1 Tax=Aridibaculum aurantiacum TaxID=2810307 RepID=UPI001A956BDD|nr:MmcQ/YjbR family DNA-binding protein [Aridibaculum aurantiacum]
MLLLFFAMVTGEEFRTMALAFEEAVEQPHFEKPSFRIRKKIFATLDIKKQQAVVKLSELEQSVFCAYKKSIIYPVAGTWGRQGWTIIELDQVIPQMLHDALTTAYCNVAPAKLAEKYKQ